jgi:hypothetical protein
MSAILSKITKFVKRQGAHSGLNQTNNSFKMAAAIVAPFLGVWLLLTVFAPPEWKSVTTAFAFIGWIVYIFALYAKAKADVASYLPFPQSHWFFPDGQQISYDLLIPPNGWEMISDYKDGSKLYRVNFKEKVAYQEADRPYPDIFNYALWKLPAEWNDSFKRNGHGEFFFENLFVDHPACENIEVSVIDWEERGSNRLPICVITGCSYFFVEAMKSGGKAFPENERTLDKESKLEAINIELREKNRELTTRNGYLEREAEQYTKTEPEDIIELRDKSLDAFWTRHKTIMNAGKKSIWLRLINGKTLGYALIAIAVILILAHFLAGWP